MASIKECKQNKKGQRVFEIRVYLGKNIPMPTKRWAAPLNWSQASITRELNRIAGAFEAECQRGEFITRAAEKAAEEEAAKLAAEEAARRYTVKRFCDEIYMPEKTITVSENTRLYYLNSIEKHILPAIGEKNIEEIKAKDITKLLLDMKAKPFAFKTIKSVYMCLNQIFQMAYMNDMIPNNPCDKVTPPKRSKEELRKPVDAFTIQEVQHIRKCAEKEPLKVEILIKLLLDTGCRRAEANGLKWSRVDLEAGTITIDCTLNYSKDKGVYESTPKSGQLRTIDISPELVNLLRLLKNTQLLEEKTRAAKASKASGEEINPQPLNFVFCQNGSLEPLFPSTATRIFGNFKKKYGLDGFYPHKCRHTFASIALTSGADIVSVSKKLGHSDISTTLDIYSHTTQESIKAASDIYRNAISQDKLTKQA